MCTLRIWPQKARACIWPPKIQPLSTRLCTEAHLYTRMHFGSEQFLERWPYSPNPTEFTFCSRKPKQAPVAFSYSITTNMFTNMEVPIIIISINSQYTILYMYIHTYICAIYTDKTQCECIFYLFPNQLSAVIAASPCAGCLDRLPLK